MFGNFGDLKKIITDDYANNDRDAVQLKIVLKRLDEGFAGMKATDKAHRKVVRMKG